MRPVPAGIPLLCAALHWGCPSSPAHPVADAGPADARGAGIDGNVSPDAAHADATAPISFNSCVSTPADTDQVAIVLVGPLHEAEEAMYWTMHSHIPFTFFAGHSDLGDLSDNGEALIQIGHHRVLPRAVDGDSASGAEITMLRAQIGSTACQGSSPLESCLSSAATLVMAGVDDCALAGMVESYRSIPVSWDGALDFRDVDELEEEDVDTDVRGVAVFRTDQWSILEPFIAAHFYAGTDFVSLLDMPQVAPAYAQRVARVTIDDVPGFVAEVAGDYDFNDTTLVSVDLADVGATALFVRLRTGSDPPAIGSLRVRGFLNPDATLPWPTATASFDLDYGTPGSLPIHGHEGLIVLDAQLIVDSPSFSAQQFVFSLADEDAEGFVTGALDAEVELIRTAPTVD